MKNSSNTPPAPGSTARPPPSASRKDGSEPRQSILGRRRACSTVPRAAAGKTLLGYIAERFTYHDAGAWSQLITGGRLLLDGAVASQTTILRGGETLEFLPPPRTEPPVDREFRAIYEDAHLLVLNKPGNLPCHPGGKFFHHTLWAFLREAGHSELHFINRLDRETSGLVLLAKSANAARACRRLQARGEIEKAYLALVEGAFQQRVEARGWIGTVHGKKIRKKQQFFFGDEPPKPAGPGARPYRRARTIFEPCLRLGELSLVHAFPKTGRLHQIRATLEAMGFPLVGDKLYGAAPDLFPRFIEQRLRPEDHERLRLRRQALHAAELRFLHPITGEPLHFSAPIPNDMRELIGPELPPGAMNRLQTEK